MTIRFQRPVGAAADLAELEYVSALHQTQSGNVRTDGSIRDVDIMHFLRSRYGIQVDLDTVRHTILTGLGGDFEEGGGDKSGEERPPNDEEEAGDEEKKEEEEEEEEEEGIDLAEMAAILLIPTLLKSARNEHLPHAEASDDGNNDAGEIFYHSSSTKRKKKKKLSRDDFDSDGQYRAYLAHWKLHKSLQPKRGLLRDVLTMILKDVTGSSTPKRLSVSLMREILTAYGEEELASDDDLLEEMVQAAAGENENEFLDANAFARALTSDVVLYDVANETRLSSNYNDVLMAADVVSEKAVAEEENDFTPDPTAEEKLKVAFDAPAIDFVADQFMSKKLVVFLWTGFVLVYFSYRKYIDKLIGSEVKFAMEVDDINECDYVLEKYNYTFDLYGADEYVTCVEDWWHRTTESKGIVKDWNCPDINGRINYGCLILKSVVKWLYVLALLMILGLAYIGLGSIGNSVRARHKWPIIFGALAVGTMSYLFFFLFYRSEDYDDSYTENIPFNDEWGQEFNVTLTLDVVEKKSTVYEVVVEILALIVSTMVIIIQLYFLIVPLLKRYCIKGDSAAIGRLFVPGSIKAEAQAKQASARKINALVNNARDVHGTIQDTEPGTDQMSFGQGLINFSLQENKVEETGGFLWTWKRIFSGELSTVEGVWISARIWAGNLAQVLISLFVLFFGFNITDVVVEKWHEGKTSNEILFTILGWFGINLNGNEIAQAATDTVQFIMNGFISLTHGELGCEETFGYIIDHFDDSNASLPENFQVDPTGICVLLEHAVENDLHNVSGVVKKVSLTATNAVNRVVGKLSSSIYPEKEVMVKAPLIVATIVAFLSCLTLSLIYIPSVISTTLKLRSGVIPFFHDKRNQKMYRKSMDQVTILLGSMFWALLYSAALLGAIVGGIVFLFLWQVTSRHMAVVCAQLVGLAVTISLKMIIVFVFLKATVYVGYYRKRPFQGNLVSLILEVANIGYAIGTALSRAMKLVLISVFYIGRLDTPLLADGVSVGPLGDTYPTIFRKDILLTEAHRHPYLELLGTMYMFKIRYGEKFGTKAGYCFRLIFAVTLMPWLRKYRVMARPNLLDDEDRRNKIEGGCFDNSMLLPKTSIIKASLIVGPMMGKSARDQLTRNDESSEIMELRAENERLRKALAHQSDVSNMEQSGDDIS